MINLFHVSFNDEIKKIIIDTLDSKAVASGPNISALEETLCKFYPGKFPLAVNDMTSGMTLVLNALGLKEGDEVIVSPFSCLATTSPLALLGIKPVWVDVDPYTMAMNLESIKESISSKTKAILAYHVAGYPSEIIKLSEIARKNNLSLIEDCNSAFGSQYNNQLLGSWADATVLSFYPNRQIGSIDGGAVIFREKAYYDVAKLRRRYGVDFNGFRKENGEINEKKDVATYGYSATMNNISAGVISSKLNRYEVEMAVTERNVSFLDKLILQLLSKYSDSIVAINPIPGARVNNWVYFLAVKDKESFMEEMKKRGVHVSSLHLRNDLYTCFNGEKKELPGIDIVASSVVAIPCGHWLSEKDMNELATVLEQTLTYLAKQ